MSDSIREKSKAARNINRPAVTAGVAAAVLTAAVVLLRPDTYRAEARIFESGQRSGDELQTLAAAEDVVEAAVRSDPVSRYDLTADAFRRDAGTEQPLAGAVLTLWAKDEDSVRASNRAEAWAQAVCAAVQPAEMESACFAVDPPVRQDKRIWLKVLAGGLLGALIGFGGSHLHNRWKEKENGYMAKRERSEKRAPDAAQALLKKLRSGKARVGVVGLGYVGLPLVEAFGRAGYSVVGIDVDPRKIESLRKGKSYIEDVPSARIAALVRKGALYATNDFAMVESLDAVSICVPTPLRKTGDPDLSYIMNVTEEIAKHIHPGMVIVLESTTYPGTTREILMTKFEARGFKVGTDIFLAFSPERVDPGRRDWTTINTPKVIGGITPACLEAAVAYYGRAIDNLVTVSSAEAAEMSKLLENTFRAVNIGLVNEMAIMCDHLGLDVWEVIEAAASKPFGFMKFTPGPGLGGHCIPIDPLYLSWKLRAVNYNARFIELASEINTNMPRYVVQKIQTALNARRKALKGSRVLVLGVAYKPDVSDLRESPALDVIGLLTAQGAAVEYHDPFVPAVTHEAVHLESVPDLERAVQQADCVVIVTNHSGYNWKKILAGAQLIVDTRNALGGLGLGSDKVTRL
jgi:UDP-N-acetyl-D-glucosamine dehydrogenase